jgi:hypothetical protein
MPNVRVWNDNIYPYKEVFKGDKIYIEPKQYIEMNEEDAKAFRGTFAPMVFDADGNDTPQGYKMIRIEKITSEPSPSIKVDDLLCLVCKYKASSKADLSEHLKTHSGQIVVDELAEKEMQAKRKAKGAA